VTHFPRYGLRASLSLHPAADIAATAGCHEPQTRTIGASMGTVAGTAVDALTDALEASENDPVTYIQGLDDPDLIRLWAALRCSLPRGGTNTKSLYDATVPEYRRRMSR
jgi:hypothetical protein